MATRTSQALGLGWATWIDLDSDTEDGPVMLTSKNNTHPHAFCRDAAEAQDVFGVKRGAYIDRLPGNPQHSSFVQSFSPEAMERIKVESAQFYAEQFKAAEAKAAEADTVVEDEPAKPAKPARRTR